MYQYGVLQQCNLSGLQSAPVLETDHWKLVIRQVGYVKQSDSKWVILVINRFCHPTTMCSMSFHFDISKQKHSFLKEEISVNKGNLSMMHKVYLFYLLCLLLFVLLLPFRTAQSFVLETNHSNTTTTTAVRFRGQTTRNLTGLSPKRDCDSQTAVCPERVIKTAFRLWGQKIWN